MNPVQSLLTTHSLGEMLLLGGCCCCPYSNYNISRVCLPMKAIKMGMNEGRLKAHSGLLARSQRRLLLLFLLRVSLFHW